MKAPLWPALVAGLLFLAGCSQPPAAPNGTDKPAAEARARIAVIPKGTTHEFWKTVHAGAAKAGEELGVEVVWKGPLKEDDRESQIKVVEDFTTQQADAIVLAPLDDTALRQPVMDARSAGIPVVVFDSALKHEDVASFVATDNRKAGGMAGEAMVQALGGKGKVILLRYQEGSASTTEREEGFLEAVSAGGLEVVVKDRYAGATVESAQAEAENLLGRFKGGFDGVFCPNESSAFGMLNALRGAGLAGKVKFFGFDASTQLVAGLKSGEIDGLVVQDPFNMGYLAVKAAVAALRKETVEKRMDTGATLVTKANMGDEAVARLLDPPKL
jgi:ribose transport system substrate-binding protein